MSSKSDSVTGQQRTTDRCVAVDTGSAPVSAAPSQRTISDSDVRESSAVVQAQEPEEIAYCVRTSEVILSRYSVGGLLGFGSFGTVVAAEDTITGRAVAVKLLHKAVNGPKDVTVEEQVYEALVAGCCPKFRLFAEVLASGEHRGFHCIIFERCDLSLYDAIKGHRGLIPFPRRQVAEIAEQVLRGIDYLHSIGIVHADIKPDNIVFKSSAVVNLLALDVGGGFRSKRMLASTELRIIDLGSAVNLSGEVRSHRLPGSHGYRAPEVVLGRSWSFGVDAFAIGCVIAEATILSNVFDSDYDSEREYFAILDRVVGPFSRSYAAGVERNFPGMFSWNGARLSVAYPPAGVLLSRELHSQALLRIEQAKPLSSVLHHHELCDLVRGLICPDPVERLSCEDAMKHKYFEVLRDL